MTENQRVLEWCVKDVGKDRQAEALLRAIIRGAAKSAPIADLQRIGQSLVEIYRETAMRNLEEN